MHKTNYCSFFLYIILKVFILDVVSYEFKAKFNSQINKLVEVHNINMYTSRLEIKNESFNYPYVYELYIFDPETNTNDNPSADKVLRSKSAKLYICINCKFAEWTRNQLLQLIEHTKITDNEISRSNYNNDINANFENSETINQFIYNANTFVNILFSYIKNQSRSAQLDTSILKTLLSLKFKINFIQSYRIALETSPSVKYVSDVAVPKILEILNLVQQFEALNCDVPRLFYQNRQYYGYLTDTENRSKKNYTINEFLSLIEPLNLNTFDGHCDVEQLLLNRVISSDDIVSKDLANITVGLSCKKQVSLKDLYEQVKRTDDLAIIFWYQSVMFDALIQVLCVHLNNFTYHDSSFDQKGIPGMLKKLEFFYSDVSSLPQEVVESFKSLTSKINSVDTIRSAISVLDKHRRNLELPNPASDMPYYTLTVDVKRFERPAESVIFLDELMRDSNDYKCFVRVYELLYTDNQTDRISNTENLRKVQDFVDKKICAKEPINGTTNEMDVKTNVSDGVRHKSKPRRMAEMLLNRVYSPKSEHGTARELIASQGCTLVSRLYRDCFETFVNLKEKLVPRDFLQQLKNNITEKLQSLVHSLTCFSDESNLIPFKEITFSLVPSWTMIYYRLFKEHDNTDVLRFLYLTMTELNKIDIEMCKPSGKYNYLMFSYVDNVAVQLGTPNEEEKYSDNAGVTINPETDFIRFTELIQLFERKPAVFRKYRKTVSILWKGQEMEINDVYLAVRSAVLSPIFVYSLYDVYFKFCFAVIFHETHNLFTGLLANRKEMAGTTDEIVQNRINELESKHSLPVEIFPKYFHGYIQNYNLYFKYALRLVLSSKNNPNTYQLKSEAERFRNRVLNEINMLGVLLTFDEKVILQQPSCYEFMSFINSQGKSKKITMKRTSKFNYNFFNYFLEGILDDLSTVNNEYNHFEKTLGNPKTKIN